MAELARLLPVCTARIQFGRDRIDQSNHIAFCDLHGLEVADLRQDMPIEHGTIVLYRSRGLVWFGVSLDPLVSQFSECQCFAANPFAGGRIGPFQLVLDLGLQALGFPSCLLEGT